MIQFVHIRRECIASLSKKNATWRRQILNNVGKRLCFNGKRVWYFVLAPIVVINRKKSS